MDLVFNGHCGSASELGTDSPVNLNFTATHDRGPFPYAWQSSDDYSSDCMNTESSATAAKRVPLSKTTMRKKGMRKTATVQHSVMLDIKDRGSDADVLNNAGAIPASTDILAFPLQHPTPPCQIHLPYC